VNSSGSAQVREFLRFSGIGLLSAVLGWVLLYALVSVAGWNYLVAYTISFLAINALSYVTAGTYAFRAGDRGNRRGLLRYYLINLASLVCNGIALAALVGRFGLNYLVAAVLLSIVNAPINFLLHRRLTYRIGVREPGAT